MVAPQLGLPAFFALARSVDIGDVEIRNDIAGKAILDGTPAAAVRRMAEDAGVTILTINALQKFNHWSPERAAEAEALADYCAGCGAAALVLVAANDGTGHADAERVANATEGLAGLKPILSARGIVGLVECLGFEACSLRRKSEAVTAIDAAGGRDVFRLVHDTFHHHLAGEAAIFPGLTGLVHVSGVDDPFLNATDMRDPHRVLVGPGDRLNNIAQIGALRAAGCEAPISFEPFAAELGALANPAETIRQSMDFIGTGTAALAA
jgi:2-keto-myo-inositol isomerase